MRPLGMLLLAVMASGCAVNAQRVSLYAKTKPEVLRCGDAMQVTLGVAPVQDKRPTEERAGKKPGGLFLLLWNQRIGNYITGDRDFTTPVDKAMAQRMAHSIAQTNCFFETKLLEQQIPPQPSSEDLLILLAKEKAHYVLASEVKHLYGKQHQRSYFYALPAFFVSLFGWDNNVGTAQGKAEILFTLYDTRSGYEVWRENVSADSDSAIRGSYPQVAQEAFVKAADRLANELYRFARAAQGASPELLKDR